MPFSEEKRKCPICGEYESWDFMTHVNGTFCCQKCYIRLFEQDEQTVIKARNDEFYEAIAKILIAKPEFAKLMEEIATVACDLTNAMSNMIGELDWDEVLKKMGEEYNNEKH